MPLSMTTNNSEIKLGVGDLAVSIKPNESIKTFALGSCVALFLLDIESGAVGMGHIALPNSKTAPEKARILPGYFADTGISALIAKMARWGFKGNYRRLRAKITGGSHYVDRADYFMIGKKNVSAIKKILENNKIKIVGEDVGLTFCRTVMVNVGTFKVTLSSPGKKDWYL